MAHIGEKLGFRLARLCELFVQMRELGGREPLLVVETLELPAHVIYPVREDTELVAIGHADAAAKVARRHLIQQAMSLAHREDKRP